MATTTTPRIRQIAADLREEGAYVQATSLDQLASQRDHLLAALKNLCDATIDARIDLPTTLDAARAAIANGVNP